jgi:hypothetical protein
MEARGIRLQGERAISRKTIAQGRPGVPAHLAVTRVHFVRTIAGAEGTRLSLRPLRFRGHRRSHHFGRFAPRECEGVFDVIARSEATKQSSFLLWRRQWIASLRSQ